MEAPAARRLLRAASAETAELAGIRILKILVMVNTRKKFGGNELALAGAVKEDLACSGSSPLNKSDQVISLRAHDGECERASWSGPHEVASNKQVTSSKRQAFEPTCSTNKRQASQP